MTELPKTFDPAAIEAKWYAHWEESNAFRPERPDAPPFTIVMPPPNVTGSLHIGHALDITLQDVLVRHARLCGKDALWVAGTDHAGIATQMVVERQMMERQDKRTNYSRDDFVQKVWDWKAESGGTITRQLRRLGASCDWANERFTMDEGFSKAVIKVFVDLYNQGLLYRDKRLVNWDPELKTAISDLEVETREVQGHMWHFKYPLAGGETYTYVERDADGQVVFQEERDYISIATTRPETMLGDGAVAVHPDDARYAPIVGKLCEIPVGPKAQRRLIPIITDDYPDPDFGSGAVKITGAHDQNDYGVAQRNGIPMYRLMDEGAYLRADGAPYAEAAARAKAIAAGGVASAADIDALNLVPDAYRGLDRYAARKQVVADIDAEGLMLRVEDKTIMQPFGDRSGVVIEPMLTDQWYVDAKTLAQPAIEAVRSGAIKVVPQSWEKTWFQWLENIQPWCVSRQLWWGHRIPAWFDAEGNHYVAEDAAGAQALAGEGVALTQDEDVLDTWFSSALWPFGTLGWPDADAKLAKHYPNDVLISGFDILFFWDARMAMQGLHFMKEVPWKTLYLHGLVRAPDGSKMSKSKGNTVDPLGLIDKYGADALRFTLAAMESQGRDIKLDEKRVEGYRNFATKLWNAARFLQGNGVGASTSIKAPEATLAVNKWIIGEVVETLAKLDAAFADLRYDAMADAVYHFAWGTFCDWYIELVKGAFDDETRAVAGWAFDQILVMLHPFMPFITEELWGDRTTRLIHASWPVPTATIDLDAKAEIAWVQQLVEALRQARSENSISPTQKNNCYIRGLSPKNRERLLSHADFIGRQARFSAVQIDESDHIGALGPNQRPEHAPLQLEVLFEGIQVPFDEAVFILNVDEPIDREADRARLTKSAEAAEKEAVSLAGRLNNPAFVEKAKPEAVEKARADHAEKSAEAERLRAALARLG
ncbi:valine--tRNA ligase [Sphingomonas sp. SUN039]|uniref:valine--tRNA ligase n=1 Tax=Sphingomonas sp. SUN039 TaxID=2937787 RepID=UPI00216433B5|nr:valine--tRNA ligase [Sphingomonas sp. SUN039]UVO53410.1 valine--tRNA ligase [Sphingomonas sp. SUN039]